MTSTEHLGLDPALSALIGQLDQAVPPVRDQSPQQLRDTFKALVAATEGPGFEREPVGRSEDRALPGSEVPIPVRVYTPADDPRAVVVYFHGGGFAIGDLDTHDKVARRFCNGVAAVVVAVHYRLAPENPFPAAFVDCFDATTWAASQWPDLPLLVAGDSAGGTLAGCVAQRARDEGAPAITCQVLIYPGIDADLETESMMAVGEGYLVSRDDLATYLDWYLPDPARRMDPYTMPGHAAALEGLPPAIITSAGFDPLRSAEEDYVSRLRDAGIHVVYQPHPDLTHGWTELVNVIPAAAAAMDELIATVADVVSEIAR